MGDETTKRFVQFPTEMEFGAYVIVCNVPACPGAGKPLLVLIVVLELYSSYSALSSAPDGSSSGSPEFMSGDKI